MTNEKCYKLYWCSQTAAFAPEVLLEEGGISFQKIKIDIYKGENFSKDYLAINPAGFVPTLITPEGERISESAAIMLYLTERHQLRFAPEIGDPKRADFLDLLFFFCTTFPASTKRYYYPKRLVSEEKEVANLRAQSIEEQDRLWQIVEDRLARYGGPFLLGEDFSLIDIQLAMLVPWYPDEAGLLQTHPRVSRCFEAVAARPIAGQVMAAHGSLEIFD